MGVSLYFMVITKIKIKKEKFENPNEETLQEIKPWIEKYVDMSLFNFQETQECWIYSMKDEYLQNYLYDFIYNELIRFNSKEDLKNLIELKNINSNYLKKYDENERKNLKLEYGKHDSVFYWRDWYQYFGVVSKNRWKKIEFDGFNYLYCGRIDWNDDNDILEFVEELIRTQSDNPLRKAANVLVG